MRAWLLLMLAEGEAHGYELQNRLADLGLNPVVGSVYRVLRAMETDGCVRADWRPSAGGPERRVYRLLARGRRELETTAEVMAVRRRLLARYLERYRALAG